jgi:hypothetical protein
MQPGAQSLADQGVAACQACTFMEPAGSCLVATSPLEPVGGVCGRVRVPEGGGMRGAGSRAGLRRFRGPAAPVAAILRHGISWETTKLGLARPAMIRSRSCRL